MVPIGEIVGRTVVDIEDLFTPNDYLSLYNKAFGKSLDVSVLTGSDSIVSQIARHEGLERFNHNKPAEALLRDRSLLAGLSPDTLASFEKLIRRLNATMPTD